MPELVELRSICEEHGVELLPVSLDAVLPRGPVQSPAGVEAFLEEHGWDLPGAVFEGDFAALSERFGVRGTPTTIAFDRAGKRAGRFVGPPGLAAYRELVERLATD